ncbi:hypothetical protein Tco_0956901, partial [Tanacetum coccineum]
MISFGDQFLNDKPSEADNEKTIADTEAESMVSVTIQQDTSITPPMTSPVIDIVTRPDSPNVHWPLATTTTTTAAPPPPPTTTTTTTLPLPPQPQQGSSNSILINRMGELEQHIADLIRLKRKLRRKDKQDSPNTPLGSPPSPPPPLPPPPLPPPSGASRASGTTGASDSAQTPPPPPPSLSTHQGD